MKKKFFYDGRRNRFFGEGNVSTNKEVKIKLSRMVT
ncbi:hypothetical protein IGJ34_002127 [Enterococcus sp. AZ177]